MWTIKSRFFPMHLYVVVMLSYVILMRLNLLKLNHIDHMKLFDICQYHDWPVNDFDKNAVHQKPSNINDKNMKPYFENAV